MRERDREGESNKSEEGRETEPCPGTASAISSSAATSTAFETKSDP